MNGPLVLLAVLALGTASPVDNRKIQEILYGSGVNRNSALESQLRNLLEDLRSIMLTGTDDIPVLDPFKLNYLALDEQVLPVPGLKIEIGEATVTKLSTFVIDELSVQRTTLIPLRYRLGFDLAIPVLEIDAAHYDLFVPIMGLTIFGKGDAKINIIEPRITGYVIVRPSVGFGSLYVRLDECEINFKLGGFDPQINGILGDDPAVNDFVNSFLKFLIPDLVELYEEVITETLSSIVVEVGNDILSDINLIDIIG